jgi:long-chain-fatty-acid--CoA ligase ACSBG
VGSGIYTTNTPEACEHVINDSLSQIVVVENNDQLKKILKIKDNCKYLKSIVQYTGEVQDSHNGLVISVGILFLLFLIKNNASSFKWKSFLELSSWISDVELNGRIKKIAPNKCASLIYTSGTTGSPKAAMLSHDNIYYCASFCIDLVKMNDCRERIVSFLPLNHIAGQLCDIYVPVLCGATVYFAQPDAMKGSLATTLAEVKPTMFMGVPRVYEKMQDKMIQMSKTGGLKFFIIFI